MGKGLIGLDLRACMESILKGEVSVDDIEMIYDDIIVSNDDNKYEEFLNIRHRNLLKHIAIKEFSKETDYKTAISRSDELLPKLEQQAKEVLKNIIESGKITEFSYRIPKAQLEEVTYSREEEITEEVELKDDERVFRVNGKNYSLPGNRTTLSEIANNGQNSHIWYNNKLEVISELLKYGNRVLDSQREGQLQTASASMAMLICPEYKKEIEEIIKIKHSIAKKTPDTHYYKPLPGMDYDDILQKLEELIQQREEHTATEIGEGVSNIRLEEFNQGLKDITNVKEKEKESQIKE